MELKEAIEILLDFKWRDVAYGKMEEAIDTVVQTLEDIAFKTRLAEGYLEILEKHSINHWDNFACVQEVVAVENLRTRINDIQELLKGE